MASASYPDPDPEASPPARRPSGRFASAIVWGGLCACTPAPDVPAAAALGVEEIDVALPACGPEHTLPPLAVDTLARGLEVPWDLAFLPGGDALVTERVGRIRMVDPSGTLRSAPWAVVDGLAGEEVGLMGIDTRIADDGGVEVYVAAALDHTGGAWPVRVVKGLARRVARVWNPLGGQPRVLAVFRYHLDPSGAGSEAPDTVLEIVPQGRLHGGGAVAFGPDGLLYVTNGDGAQPDWTLRADWPGGKVLRFTPEGKPAPLRPSDPIPTIVRGLRNSQSLAWHPVTGEIVLVDHGPTGIASDRHRHGNDEIDVARPGADLGWPVVAGATRGGDLVSPVAEWTPAIAPAGLALSWDDDGPWGRAALVTGLADGRLRHLPFADDGGPTRVVCEQWILDRGYGRLRLVAVAPDGSLWVGTSNRDGRGGPRPDDDLLLRITVATEAPDSQARP